MESQTRGVADALVSLRGRGSSSSQAGPDGAAGVGRVASDAAEPRRSVRVAKRNRHFIESSSEEEKKADDNVQPADEEEDDECREESDEEEGGEEEGDAFPVFRSPNLETRERRASRRRLTDDAAVGRFLTQKRR